MTKTAVSEVWRATGRRKTSSAHVIVKPGSGKITVNKRDLDEYFGANTTWRRESTRPLQELELEGQFDIQARIHGGGMTGQAEAMRLAISRALDACEQSRLKLDDNNAAIDEGIIEDVRVWRRKLKKLKFLMRDARAVYHKLAGRRKARKKPQFSKR